MATTLSNVTLGKGLIWVDQHSQVNVAQTMVRTLGGVPIFYHASLKSGTPITLESLEDSGWQTKETVDQLYALSSVAGAQYLLNFGTVQFSVLFRHTDQPAFESSPLVPRTLAVSGDYFTIKLKLITV